MPRTEDVQDTTAADPVRHRDRGGPQDGVLVLHGAGDPFQDAGGERVHGHLPTPAVRPLTN